MMKGILKSITAIDKKIFVLALFCCLAYNPSLAQQADRMPAKVTKNKIVYERVSFSQLFFKHQPPFDVEHPDGNVTKGSGKKMPIPAEIMALHGKRVAVTGYMLPLEETAKKELKTFIFADSLVNCLFCAMIGYDQWMMGEVTSKKPFKISDEAYDEEMTIYGTLEVGEEMIDGQLTSLYRIKAEAYEGKRTKVLGIF